MRASSSDRIFKMMRNIDLIFSEIIIEYRCARCKVQRKLSINLKKTIEENYQLMKKKLSKKSINEWKKNNGMNVEKHHNCNVILAPFQMPLFFMLIDSKKAYQNIFYCVNRICNSEAMNEAYVYIYRSIFTILSMTMLLLL